MLHNLKNRPQKCGNNKIFQKNHISLPKDYKCADTVYEW